MIRTNLEKIHVGKHHYSAVRTMSIREVPRRNGLICNWSLINYVFTEEFSYCKYCVKLLSNPYPNQLLISFQRSNTRSTCKHIIAGCQ